MSQPGALDPKLSLLAPESSRSTFELSGAGAKWGEAKSPAFDRLLERRSRRQRRE
jgi:hypothetical protein